MMLPDETYDLLMAIHEQLPDAPGSRMRVPVPVVEQLLASTPHGRFYADFMALGGREVPTLEDEFNVALHHYGMELTLPRKGELFGYVTRLALA